MGKIKQGILGGFSGTTGSVVGASWKGIAYMRGKAQSIKNPRTTKQVDNRTRFGKISDIMSKAKTAVDLGYKGIAVKKSPFNCAVQDSMKLQPADDPALDYGALSFSKGGLYPVSAGQPTINADAVEVSCKLASIDTEARDACLVVVFSGDFVGAPFVVVSEGEIRLGTSATTLSAPIPAGIDYETASAYVFTYDLESSIASDSVYAGAVNPS